MEPAVGLEPTKVARLITNQFHLPLWDTGIKKFGPLTCSQIDALDLLLTHTSAAGIEPASQWQRPHTRP